jgi:hypothetical protein
MMWWEMGSGATHEIWVRFKGRKGCWGRGVGVVEDGNSWHNGMQVQTFERLTTGAT